MCLLQCSSIGVRAYVIYSVTIGVVAYVFYKVVAL